MRFARLKEGLGVSFMRSVMTLFWTLSEKITELPWIGPVSHSLVWVAIVFALAGTVLMAMVGFKLPGLEFENQLVEAAFHKEVVYGEDDRERATPAQFSAPFTDVRRNYFRLYFHYMYSDVARYAYLQFGVLVPYIALGPTLVTGVITLGVMQQIVRAFGRVESSFQYLVNSWTTIVELISVYKTAPCLRATHRAVISSAVAADARAVRRTCSFGASGISCVPWRCPRRSAIGR